MPVQGRFAVACLVGACGAALLVVFVLAGGPGSRDSRVATPAAASGCGSRVVHRVVTPAHDAGTIAFVRYQSGSYSVFVMAANGGPAHRLSPAPPRGLPTQRQIFQGTPAWSPDGRWLAFTSNRSGRSGVYVMRADGTRTRRLSISSSDDVRPSWSPDGRTLVFARSGQGRLYLIGVDGRHRRPLPHDRYTVDSDPAWSPDGSRIAFVRRLLSGEAAAVFLIGADGRGLCRLTPYTQSVYSPAWSPDGSRIVYAERRGAGFAISVVALAGSHRQTLTRDALDLTPTWSADGTKIVFARDATLYVMNADGSGVHRLTHGTIDDSPAWRPA